MASTAKIESNGLMGTLHARHFGKTIYNVVLLARLGISKLEIQSKAVMSKFVAFLPVVGNSSRLVNNSISEVNASLPKIGLP